MVLPFHTTGESEAPTGPSTLSGLRRTSTSGTYEDGEIGEGQRTFGSGGHLGVQGRRSSRRFLAWCYYDW